MIFGIILVVNIILGYNVFGDQFRKKPIFSNDTFIESFGTTAFSVILYFLISSLCLIFLLERIDIYLIELIDFSYKDEFINSGLSFAICLVPIGYFIRALYNGIYLVANKFGKKYNKKYMAELNRNEQTLILIVSCISLITVALTSEKDYELAFFIVALILGRFFWVDSSIMDFISYIRGFKLKLLVVIILYWLASAYISEIFGKRMVLFNMIGITVGFLLGMILYIVINRKKIIG